METAQKARKIEPSRWYGIGKMDPALCRTVLTKIMQRFEVTKDIFKIRAGKLSASGKRARTDVWRELARKGYFPDEISKMTTDTDAFAPEIAAIVQDIEMPPDYRSTGNHGHRSGYLPSTDDDSSPFQDVAIKSMEDNR